MTYLPQETCRPDQWGPVVRLPPPPPLASRVFLANTLVPCAQIAPPLVAAIYGAVHTCPAQQSGDLSYTNPAHFEQLIEHVRQQLPGLAAAAAADDELAVVVAMCWLGPELAGPPPAAMRDRLLGLLRREVPDAAERVGRVTEFAIAYGAGKWRTVQPGAAPWHQRWPGAIWALTLLAAPAVQKVYRWLNDHVRGFPAPPAWNEILAEANLLVMRLVCPEKQRWLAVGECLEIGCTPDETVVQITGWRPQQSRVPPGARFVLAFRGHPGVELQTPEGRCTLAAGSKAVVLARDGETRVTGDAFARVTLNEGQSCRILGPAHVTIWECTCGNVHCPQRHRLSGWNPRAVSLWSFVPSAIKGPNVRLRTGSLWAGMALPAGAREGDPRVRLAPVEFKVCSGDGLYYEGSRCPECKRPFQAGDTRRLARDSLIAVGCDPPVYIREPRLRCGNRKEHYRRTKDLAADAPVSARLGEPWDNLYEPQGPAGTVPVCPLCQKLRCGNRKEHYRKRNGLAAHAKVPKKLGEAWDEVYDHPDNAVGGTPLCPSCGQEPKVRVSHVWVRTFDQPAPGVDGNRLPDQGPDDDTPLHQEEEENDHESPISD